MGVDDRIWYLPDPDGQNGDETQGPFTTAEIVDRLRNGSIRVDDFVWAEHFQDGWKRILDLQEFKGALLRQPKLPTPKKRSKGIVASVAASQSDVKIKDQISIEHRKEVGAKNSFRRYPRVLFDADVLIHNDRTVARGRSLDLSERGLFSRVQNLEQFEKGEEVTVTIIRGGSLGTVSIRAVVVRITSKENKRGYGLLFLRMNPNVRLKIAKVVLEKIGKGEFERDGGEANIA